MLLAITIAIARREPVASVDDPMGYHIGDVILAWGTPDSVEYEGIHLIEIEFDGVDVMDCREPFAPFDTVCFSFKDDDASSERLKGTQWKGFRQP